MKKILIATSNFGESSFLLEKKLKNAGFEIIRNPYGRRLTEDETVELGRECIGIISGSEPLNASVLDRLPLLRCISRVGIGTDNIDLGAAEKNGIIVKYTPDAPTRAVAEMTVGLIFALIRNIPAQDRQIRGGIWEKKAGRLLFNRDVGIIGLGRIGRSVAVLLQGLGARVSGTDIYPDYCWAKEHAIRLVTLDKLLATSEIISVHVPLSKETKSLLGERELTLMPKGSCILNLSRGGIIDEQALYNAVKKGHLAGAAVDTFEKEPYSGRLTELETVILTPHIGSNTTESRFQMETEAVDNLIMSLAGMER